MEIDPGIISFFEKHGYQLAHDGDEIIIAKKKKRSYLTLVIAIIFVPFLSLFLYAFDGIGDKIFFAGIIFLAIGVAWNANFRGVFPYAIINFERRTFNRISRIPFIKSQLFRIHNIKDLGLKTKAVSGHTSAHEEGNTDYRKTIFIQTPKKEIDIVRIYSRQEDLEKEFEDFAKLLQSQL